MLNIEESIVEMAKVTRYLCLTLKVSKKQTKKSVCWPPGYKGAYKYVHIFVENEDEDQEFKKMFGS